MDKPVLLITFNRPEYTRQMLKALKQANVKNLFIFKDGPRPNNEDDFLKSKEIENLIKNIDWDCHIETLFLNNNLGCGYGPFTAISWAFSKVDELIILEDDCIPTVAFFNFCSLLLDKYRNNPKIRHISGRSPLTGHTVFSTYDFIYTQYAPTWGWATWKRVWENFDLQMRELQNFFNTGGYSNQFSSSKEASFFNRRYRKVLKNTKAVFHIWDYQYGLHSRSNDSLAIVPSKNLISYIGIEGTHPVSYNSSYTLLQATEEFSPQKHPDTIKLIDSYEKEYFDTFVNIEPGFLRKCWRVLKHRILRIK